MKRWLITTRENEDLDVLGAAVAETGGRLTGASPVPLDRGEQVVEAEGPDDLPQTLESHPAVRKVSPDSPLELLGGGGDL